MLSINNELKKDSIIITEHLHPKTRRYESIYDVVHMEDPFWIKLSTTSDDLTYVDYTYGGWDAGIYIMFPLDKTIAPFLMTAANFRGRYRLKK